MSLMIFGGAVAALIGIRFVSELKKVSPSYAPVKGERYGSTWDNRRPPGLPPTTRPTSSSSFGGAYLKGRLEQNGISGALFKTIKGIARSESGSRLGLPAIKFDARIIKPGDENPPDRFGTAVDGLRTPGTKIITAWGIFSWNRDQWRDLPRQQGTFPWEASVKNEVDLPIAVYQSMWDQAKRMGATDLFAARYVRVWQKGPGYAKTFKNAVLSSNWDSAWAHAVKASHKTTIDNHLTIDLA